MQNMLILQKKEKSSFWKIWTRPLLLEHVFCMIGAVSWKKTQAIQIYDTINLFHATGLFLHLLKTRFPEVFRMI